MKVSLQIGNPAQRFLSTDVIFYALYQVLIAVNGNSHLKLSAVIGGQGGEVDIKNKLGNITVGSKNRQLSIMLTQIILHCVDRYPFDCFGGGGADRVGSVYFSSKQLTLSVDDASRRLMEIVSAKSGFIRSKNEKENLYKNGR